MLGLLGQLCASQMQHFLLIETRKSTLQAKYPTIDSPFKGQDKPSLPVKLGQLLHLLGRLEIIT